MKIALSTAQRERQYYTLRDYVTVQRQRWENDWHDYVHDMCRVLDTAAEQLFVYSSARIGELFESSVRVGTGKGLCYRVACYRPFVVTSQGKWESKLTLPTGYSVRRTVGPERRARDHQVSSRECQGHAK